MFEQLKEKYYQGRIIGRCYQVSDCHSGWYFEYFLIVSRKGKIKLIPYTNFVVDSYYEKELELEQIKSIGYLEKECVKTRIKTIGKLNN